MSHTTLIEPGSGWKVLNARELWAYRDLFWQLAWRDVRVRYKQTLVGAGWAVLQPALMMAIFALFFGRVANLPTGGVPYPLFVLAGLLPWYLFATGVGAAANSLLDAERLIGKVYFPRLLVPAAAAAVAAFDFLIATGLLVVVMVAYGHGVTENLVLAVPAVGSVFVTALGVGCLLAALNVRYRDFRYALPFLIQAWMFATPTIYLSLDAAGADLPDWVRAAALANPLTGPIQFFRAAVLGGPLPWAAFLTGTAVGLVTAAVGVLYFRRVEDEFADVI